MKLFASDYDGTYCKHTKLGRQQLKENIKATKEWQEMGNLFIFATGRPISLMKIEQKIHGLVYDYIVGLNGAVIISSDGQVVFRQTIKNEIAKQIVELIQEKKITQYMVTDGLNGHYYTTFHLFKREYYLFKILKWTHRLFNLTLTQALEQPVAQIAVKTNSHEEAIQFAKIINETFGHEVVAYANLLHVDICAKNLSKASGVFEVAKRHRIETDAIYCIGDSFNDLPMIEAYHGLTMIEAVDDLKKQAEAVFKTVSEAFIYAKEKV